MAKKDYFVVDMMSLILRSKKVQIYEIDIFYHNNYTTKIRFVSKDSICNFILCIYVIGLGSITPSIIAIVYFQFLLKVTTKTESKPEDSTAQKFKQRR